ncbi:MAG: hypothetical protein FWF63_00760 [Fibromonadales bacterium]|nr:hypothetical protein [Fibromonadales bacterium]
MKENGQLNEVLEFIKRNKESYNSALKDKKIIDNYVSGNGFSPEALKIFEGDANGSVRVRAKVNAKFISGHINQLKGLLIANKFDLGGGTPPSGLVAALNNSALSALGECLNYGEGFIYIDGSLFLQLGKFPEEIQFYMDNLYAKHAPLLAFERDDVIKTTNIGKLTVDTPLELNFKGNTAIYSIGVSTNRQGG